MSSARSTMLSVTASSDRRVPCRQRLANPASPPEQETSSFSAHGIHACLKGIFPFLCCMSFLYVASMCFRVHLCRYRCIGVYVCRCFGVSVCERVSWHWYTPQIRWQQLTRRPSPRHPQGGPDVNAVLSKLGVENVDPSTATLTANLALAYVFYKVGVDRSPSPFARGHSTLFVLTRRPGDSAGPRTRAHAHWHRACSLCGQGHGQEEGRGGGAGLRSSSPCRLRGFVRHTDTRKHSRYSR